MDEKVQRIINEAATWAETVEAGLLTNGYRETAPLLRAVQLTPEQAEVFLRAYAPHEGAPWAGSIIALEAVGINII